MNWIRYPWSIENGKELVHPDDITEFIKIWPPGRVFKYIGRSENFNVIEYNEMQFRVKDDLIEKISNTPVFDFNEKVIDQKGRKGVISGISWHYKKGEPFYLITTDGVKKTRRYTAEELKKA